MARKLARIWIKDNYESLIEESLEGPVETVVAYLEQTLKDATEAGFKELKIEKDEKIYPGYDHMGYKSTEWIIRGKRLETDKEYNKRCRKQVKVKEKAQKEKEEYEAEERAEYERLTAKFGTSSRGAPNW